MLKNQQRIYNLGDLTNLFASKEKDFLKEIPSKEIGKRARTVLFGGTLTAHSSLNNPMVRYWHANFRYYVDIIKSFERMIQAYGYLIKYPAFKYYNLYRINELAWIKYHSEYFVQENYILLQRAKGWMNHLIKRTKQVPRRKVEEKQLERIRDQFAAWSKK